MAASLNFIRIFSCEMQYSERFFIEITVYYNYILAQNP